MFEAVADAGFDWVRIHVKWGDRTGKAAPYGIKPSFMVVVNETVGWVNKHGMRAMFNTHYENDGATAWFIQHEHLRRCIAASGCYLAADRGALSNRARRPAGV